MKADYKTPFKRKYFHTKRKIDEKDAIYLKNKINMKKSIRFKNKDKVEI